MKTANNVQDLINNAKASIDGWAVNGDGNLERVHKFSCLDNALEHEKTLVEMGEVKQVIDLSDIDIAFEKGLDEDGDLNHETCDEMAISVCKNSDGTVKDVAAEPAWMQSGFTFENIGAVIAKCIKTGDYSAAYRVYVDAAETFFDDGEMFATGYDYY